jgi:hypothetical protein
MEYAKLKEYYDKIDQCSLRITKDMDFDDLQEHITKLALYIEELNRTMAELLVEQTRLEHDVTNTKFQYELEFTQYLVDNSEVKKLTSSKERKDYINYFLMKDRYRNLLDKEQELRDVQKLIDLAKKKARDLDKTFPKLKTLWESLQSEMKYIKKIGSDSEYIEKVKQKINLDNSNQKTLFTDSSVENLFTNQYDYIESESLDNSDNSSQEKIVEDDLEDLLKDL